METRQFKQSLLGFTVALLLAGCSSESEEVAQAENTAPQVTVSEEAISLEEGGVARISFNAVDDATEFKKLSVSIDTGTGTNTMLGSASYSKTSKLISYSAPWLSGGDKSVNTAFTLVVSDESGATTRTPVTVTVNDIDSVVVVDSVDFPSQAFGYKNTLTSSESNMWIKEGEGAVTFSYNLLESDADTLEPGSTVSEGVVFNNDLVESFEALGGDKTKYNVKMNIPKIDTQYVDVVLNSEVSDNDGTTTFVSNITIYNDVSVTWDPSSDREISESNGGLIKFKTSEGDDYGADYKIDITYADGKELDFDVSPSFSESTGEISFSTHSGFQGNRNLKLILTVSNDIPNAAGEIFVAETVSNFNFTMIDDRDDGFGDLLGKYNSEEAMFKAAKAREDNLRVASSLSQYLMLNGWITLKEKTEFETAVLASNDAENAELQAQIEAISLNIDSDANSAEMASQFSDFSGSLDTYGNATRQIIKEWHESISSRDESRTIPLKVVSGAGINKVYGSDVTHYVGNSMYGTYESDQSEWVFTQGYQYLAVVDITDQFCF